MTVEIRNAHQNELQALLNLYQYLHATDAPLPEGPTLREVWSEILSNPKLHCLVADLDGELVVSWLLFQISREARDLMA